MKCLETCPWPGNVRELENRIRRAMVLSREDVLPEYLFEMDSRQMPLPIENVEERLKKITRQYFSDLMRMADSSESFFDHIIGIIEKTLIEEALLRTDGNQVQAAQLLGVHRSTLRKKIGDYMIS
jgi:DNA-binding NtrC family response regulator